MLDFVFIEDSPYLVHQFSLADSYYLECCAIRSGPQIKFNAVSVRVWPLVVRLLSALESCHVSRNFLNRELNSQNCDLARIQNISELGGQQDLPNVWYLAPVNVTKCFCGHGYVQPSQY
ncbi:Hypothetical_protein [Hexamita inflata]|uniref:Hypothetical_protein n=1 Tax=Hexamita inflata TaxID=28002 RepID=A0ABP1IKG1_9EUKA